MLMNLRFKLCELVKIKRKVNNKNSYKQKYFKLYNKRQPYVVVPFQQLPLAIVQGQESRRISK
jgi:hypothetical protein